MTTPKLLGAEEADTDAPLTKVDWEAINEYLERISRRLIKEIGPIGTGPKATADHELFYYSVLDPLFEAVEHRKIDDLVTAKGALRAYLTEDGNGTQQQIQAIVTQVWPELVLA